MCNKRDILGYISGRTGGYPHFMLKEIMEQPQALQNTFIGEINLATGEIDSSKEGLSKEWLRDIERIYIVAC